MRNLSSSTAKDVRRYRLFEKALDALATSPYARSVYQWVLAGPATCTLSTIRKLPLLAKAGNKCLELMAHNSIACMMAGLGNGGRVAAVVASRCRGTIAGVALLSYPLLVCSVQHAMSHFHTLLRLQCWSVC